MVLKHEDWYNIFIIGLTQTNCNMIEFMNGGGFLSLIDDKAYKFLEDLSQSCQQWDFSNCRERLALAIKRGGLYEISEDLDMKASLDNLTRKDEALALGRGRLDKSLESFNLTGEIV